MASTINSNDLEEVTITTLVPVSSCGETSIISDEDSSTSSHSSSYCDKNTSEIIAAALAAGEIPSHLPASGPVGVAAAAAIASVDSKKYKKPFTFITNPSLRKRQKTRLLKKLKNTIDEFTLRVGQQVAVVTATPSPNPIYKAFGARPLQDVMLNLRGIVMDELENALAVAQVPFEDSSLFELPPLIIDGMPTCVEKMPQAQLRAFIPLMLKYSTGRGKPGWGRESTKPPWWPDCLPWANIRMDSRNPEDKSKMSWTAALKQVVNNCYQYHGREDLLMQSFTDKKDKNTSSTESNITESKLKVESAIDNEKRVLFLKKIDSNNPVITYSDGTTVNVQNLTTLEDLPATPGDKNQIYIQTAEDGTTEILVLNQVAEAALNSDGHIILSAQGTQGFPVPTNNSGAAVPAGATVFHARVASIPQLQAVTDLASKL